MIEILVLIALILFAAYLIFTLFGQISLFLNLIILIALFFLIRKDLKDNDGHKYYLISLFLTAMLFIFSSTGLIKNFLVLTEKLLLSTAIVSVIAVYVFANLTALIYEAFIHLKEKSKK